MDDNSGEQKILIVDDEPSNIRILIEALADGAYKLIGATSGAEALECAASQEPPDLILLDVIMPDMNGYDVCRQLKANAKTRGIPVIFITVMDEDVNEAQGFGLGAVDYIAKPFSPATVNARVQTHLELKRHRDRLERTLCERTKKLSNSTRRLRQANHERMQAEEDRNRLITAIEQAAEAFVITDPDGIIRYVNPVFERHTGYSREEAMGQSAMMLESKEHGQAFYRNILGTIWQGNTWRGLITNKRKDGSLYKSMVAISPVFDAAGKIVDFVSVSRDVTREVELEAQLRRAQKLEAIGTLARGIAHDFNNIICAIMGYSELAMNNVPCDSETFQYLERIEKAGKRAADLIRQILAFSQKGDQKQQPMQIQVVLKEALKLLRGTLPSSMRIHQDIDSKCSPILAAPTQIHQVIMNLCTNAYHAMRDHDRQGIAVLDVSLKPFEVTPTHLGLPPGQYVRLRVSDNGCGMDEPTQAKIFDPYFTTKNVGEGTGLGLSTVYGIVQECKGMIKVDSTFGRGTTFNIFFPVHTMDDIPRDHRERSIPPPAPKDSPCVLVVDDEEPIAQMIQIKLNRLGYDAMAHTSGVRALGAFRDSPDRFDLIIADMTMPDMTGIQLAEKMFGIRSDIPVILCTGFNEMITEKQAKAMGVREYLKKPFIDGELEKAVHRTLEK